ncbi:MAG TPA: DUF4249 domain-containing protein, partial [Chryseolinea sp.]|nr:DUF4249 domain-containing protein [Chryseolinea sp.]
LTERTAGVYVAPQLNLDVTQQYKLRILTQNEKEYESDFVDIRQSPPLDSLTKTELHEHDRIGFYIYAHDPDNNTRYYYWTYDETYKYASLGISVYYFENGEIIPRKYAGELHECYKTIYNNNFYLGSTAGLSSDVVNRFPLMEIPQFSIKFYYGYSILLRQYAITDEAYSYFAVTKRNSENLGTLFDPIPSQPQSNLRCVNSPSTAVIGFFFASTVQKKRLFFTRQEIAGPRIPFGNGVTYGPSEYSNNDCEGKLLTTEEMTAENLQGMLIYDRVFDRVTFELIGYGVSPEECLDCRFKGGVLEAPDYWR